MRSGVINACEEEGCGIHGMAGSGVWYQACAESSVGINAWRSVVYMHVGVSVGIHACADECGLVTELCRSVANT